MRLPVLLILLLVPFVIACGQNATITTRTTMASEVDDNDSTSAPSTPSTGTTAGSTFKVSICSPLSVTGVTWPSTLDAFDINALILAMNLSGSFEGHTGWSNISNNFDGQGISLGLFNQNLGQGSLQPLMINYRDKSLSTFKSFFTSSQYTSLNSMLTKWSSSSVSSKALRTENPYEKDYSDLDDPSLLEEQDIDPIDDMSLFSKATGAASSTRNQTAVNWSVANVYSGSSFKSEWKTALQNMAKSPGYVSLQIGAAQSIHNKAEGYMRTFSMTTLRGYLFFFDIVVQNGGISTTIKNEYLAWAKKNTSASESTRLKKLLEFRLKVVRTEYINDVKARKTAIIDGKGTVHGSKRDFVKEYCVGSWTVGYALKNLNLL